MIGKWLLVLKTFIQLSLHFIQSFFDNRKNIDFQRLTASQSYARAYLYNARPQVMKAIITLIFILFFGAMALAQNTQNYDTVEPLKMGTVLDSGIDTSSGFKEVKVTIKKSVARLYKFKNSRIKKALTFTTKNNKPKLS